MEGGHLMGKNLKVILIIVAIIVILAFGIAGSYNSLVSLEQNVDGKWSQVENNLQRRNDLIPNLVATVKGYAAQERDIFQNVADARAKMAGAQGVQNTAQADQELAGALSRLLVVVERYPDLKSDANFRQLADELAGTENRLAVARKDYNEAVQGYNTKIKRFPTAIWARMFGFAQKDYYRAAPGAETPPQVDFTS
jgi:LemA protein